MIGSSAPGVLYLLIASAIAMTGLKVTARELRNIWHIRLLVLSDGLSVLQSGSDLCQRLSTPQPAVGLVLCRQSLALRYEGIWEEGCPDATPPLHPPRWVKIKTNCTWQMANHILRLPPVEFMIKR